MSSNKYPTEEGRTLQGLAFNIELGEMEDKKKAETF